MPPETDYSIAWSGKDQVLVARCAAYPQLSSAGLTPGEALAGLQRAMADALEEVALER